MVSRAERRRRRSGGLPGCRTPAGRTRRASHCCNGTPSIASVKRAAGSFGPARLRPPIEQPRGAWPPPDHRGDRPRCGPRPISRAMPAVSGVSAQPSSANHPGARHAIPAHGRRPHAAKGRARHERPAEIGGVAAARGSISARSLRSGSARNHTARCGPLPVLRQLEPLRRGGDGSCGRDRRRLRLRAGARTSGASPARRAATVRASACIASTARTVGLGSAA